MSVQNHTVRLVVEDTAKYDSTRTFTAYVSSGPGPSSSSDGVVSVEVRAQGTTDDGVSKNSGVLSMDSYYAYFGFYASAPPFGYSDRVQITMDDSARDLGANIGAKYVGSDTQYIVHFFNFPGHHVDMVWTMTGNTEGVLSATHYNTVSLLAVAATTDPSHYDTLAAHAQSNYDRTGSWHLASPADDGSAGPAAPTDWDALAAKAQARSDETGQWGVLTYDAGNGEWGHL